MVVVIQHRPSDWSIFSRAPFLRDTEVQQTSNQHREKGTLITPLITSRIMPSLPDYFNQIRSL